MKKSTKGSTGTNGKSKTTYGSGQSVDSSDKDDIVVKYNELTLEYNNVFNDRERLVKELENRDVTIEELQQSLVRLNAANETLKSELLKENETFSRQREVSTKLISSLRSQIDDLKLEVNNLKRNAVDEDLTTVTSVVSESSTKEIDLLRNQVTQLQGALFAHEQRVNVQETHVVVKEEKEVHIDSLLSDIDALRSKSEPVVDIGSVVGPLRARIAELEDQLNDLKEDISTKDLEISHRDKALASGLQDLITFRDEMEELKSIIESGNKVISEQKDEIAVANKEIDELRIKLATSALSPSIGSSADGVVSPAAEELKEQLVEAHKANAILTNQIARSNRKVLRQDEALATANEEIGKLNQIISDLEDKVRDLTSDLTSSEATNAHLEAQLDEARHRMHDVQMEHERIVAEMMAEIESLKRQVAALTKESAEKSATISELKADLEDLFMSLEQRNEEYAAAQERIAFLEAELLKRVMELTQQLDKVTAERDSAVAVLQGIADKDALEKRLKEHDSKQRKEKRSFKDKADVPVPFEVSTDVSDIAPRGKHIFDPVLVTADGRVSSAAPNSPSSPKVPTPMSTGSKRVKSKKMWTALGHVLMNSQIDALVNPQSADSIIAALRKTCAALNLEVDELKEKIDVGDQEKQKLQEELVFKGQELDVANEIAADLTKGWNDDKQKNAALIEELNRRLKALEADKMEVQLKMTDLESLHEAQKKEKESLEEKVAQLEEELARVRKELADAKKDLSSTSDDLMKQLKALRDANEEQALVITDLQGNVVDLEAQVERLTRASDQKTDEIEQLTYRLADVNSELDGKIEDYKKALGDIADLEVTVNELKAKILDLNLSISRLEAARDELQAAKDAMEIEIFEVREEFEEMAAEKTQVEDELQKRLQELVDLRSLLKDVQKELAEMKSRYNASVDENVELTQTLGEKDARITTLLSEIGALRSVIENLKGDLADSVDENAKLASDKEKLFSQNKRQSEEIEKLLAEAKQLQSDLASEQSTNKSLSGKFRGLEEDFARLTEQFNRTQGVQAGVIADLQKERDDLLQEVNDLKKEVERLSKALAKSNDDVAALRSELQNNAVMMSELEKALHDVNTAATKDRETIADLNAKLVVQQRENLSLESAVSQLKGEANTLSAEVDKLTTDLEQRDEALAARHQEVIDLKTRLEEILEELSEANKLIQEQKQDIADANHVIHELEEDLEKERLRFDKLKVQHEHSTAGYEAKIAKLEAEIAALSQAVNDKDGTNADQSSTINRMAADLAAALNKINDLEALLTDLKVLVADKNAEITQQNDDIKSLEERLKQLQSSMESAAKSIVDLSSANEALREKLVASEKDNDKLNKQLVKQKDQTDKALAALKAKVTAAELEAANKEDDLVFARQRLTELESVVAELNVANNKLEDRVKKLNADLSQKIDSITNLTENLNKVQDKLKEAYALIAEQKQDIADANHAIHELEEDLQKEGDRYIDLQRESAFTEKSLRGNVTRLEDELERLRKMLATNNEKHEAYKQEAADKLDANAAELENLENERKRLQAELDELTALSEGMNGDIQTISHIMMDLRDQLAAKESELDVADSAIKALEAELAGLKRDYCVTNDSLKKVEAEKDGLLNDLSDVQSLRDGLQKENVEQKARIAELEQCVDDAKKTVRDVEDALAKESDKFNKYKDMSTNLINSLKDKISGLEAEVEAGCSTLAAKEGIIAQLNETLARMTADLADALNRISELESQNQSLKILLSAREADVTVRDDTITLLEKRMASKTQEVDELKRAAEQLEDEFQRTKDIDAAEIAALYAKIAALEDKLELEHLLVESHVEKIVELEIKVADLIVNLKKKTDEVDQRDAALTLRRQELLDAKSALEELENENELLKKTNEHQGVELGTAKMEIERLKAALTEEQEKFVRLNEKSNADRTRLEGEVAQLIDDLITSRKEKEELAATLSEAYNEIERLKALLNALQEKFNEYEIESVERLALKTSELENLEIERSRLQAELDALTSMSDSMNEDIERISELMASLQSQLAERDMEVGDAELRISELEKILNEANQVKDKQKSLISEQQAKIGDLEAVLAKETDKYNKYRDTSTGIINSLKDKISGLQGEIASLKDAIAEKDTTINQMASDMAEALNKIESLQSDVADLQADLEDRNGQITQRDEALAKGLQDLIDFREEMEELKSIIADLNQQNSKLKQELRQKYNEAHDVRVKNVELTEAATAMEKNLSDKIAELETEIDRLKVQIANANECHANEMNLLNGRYNELEAESAAKLANKDTVIAAALNKCKQLQGEIDGLKSELLDVNGQLAEKSNECDRANELIGELSNRVNGLEADLSELKARTDAEISQLKNDLSDALKLAEDRLSEVNRLLSVLDDKDYFIQLKEVEIVRLNDVIEDLNKRIDGLVDDLEAANELQLKSERDFEKAVTALNEVKKQMQNTIDDKNFEVDRLNALVESLQQQLADKDKELFITNESLKTATGKKDDALAKIEALQQQVDDLTAESERKSGELEQRDEALALRRQELIDLKNELAQIVEEKDDTIAGLEAEIERLNKIMKSLESAHIGRENELLKVIDGLRAQLAVVQNDVARVTVERDEALTQLKQLADAADEERRLKEDEKARRSAMRMFSDKAAVLAAQEVNSDYFAQEEEELFNKCEFEVDLTGSEFPVAMAEPPYKAETPTRRGLINTSKTGIGALLLSPWELDYLNNPESTESEIVRLKQELVHAAGVIAEQNQALNEADALRSELENDLREAKGNGEKLAWDLKALEGRLTSEIDDLKRQLDYALNNLEARKEELADVTRKYNELEAESAAKLANKDTVIAAALNKCKQLQGEIDGLKSELLDVNGQLAEKSNECDRANELIGELSNRVNGLEADLSELKARTDAEISQLKNDLSDALKLAEDRLSQIEVLNQVVKDKNDELAGLAYDLREKKDELIASELCVKQLQGVVADLTAEGSALRSARDDTNYRLQHLKTGKEAAESLVESLRSERAQLLSDVSDLQASIIALEKKNADLKELVESLMKDLDQANSMVTEKNQTIDVLSAENERLKKEVSNRDDALTARLNEINRLKETLEETQNDLDNSRGKNLELSKALVESTECIKQLEVAMNAEKDRAAKLEFELRRTVQDQTDEIKRLEMRVADLEKDLSDSMAKFEKYRKETSETIEQNNVDMENLENERRRLQAELDELRALSDSMNGDIQTISQLMMDLRDQLAAKEAQLEASNDKVRALETQLEDWKHKHEDVCTSLKEVEEDRDALQKELNEVTKERDNLLQEMGKQKARIAELEQCVDDAKKTIRDVEDALAKESDKFNKYKDMSTNLINSLKDKISGLQGELSTTTASIAELNIQIVGLQGELSMKDVQIEDSQALSSALKHKLAAAEDVIADLKSQLSRAEAVNRDKIKEINRLFDLVDQVNGELSAALKKIDHLEQSAEVDRETIGKVEAEFRALSKELDKVKVETSQTIAVQQSKIAALEAELTNVKSAFKNSQEKADSLGAEKVALEKKLAEALKKIASLEANVGGLQETVKSLEAALDAKNMELVKKSHELFELTEKADGLTRDFTKASASIDALQKELKDACMTNSELEKKLAVEKDRIETFSAESKREYKRLNGIIDVLKNELDANQKQLTKTKDELKTAEDQLKASRQLTEQQAARIKALEKELTAANKAVDQRSAALEQLQNEIVLLNDSVVAVTAESKKRAARVKELDTITAQQKETLEEQEMKIDELDNDVGYLKDVLADANKANEKLKSDLKTTSADLVDSRTKNGELTKQNAFLNNDLEVLKKQHAEYVMKSQNLVKELQNRLAASNERIEELEDQLKVAESQMKALEEKQTSLLRDLDLSAKLFHQQAAEIKQLTVDLTREQNLLLQEKNSNKELRNRIAEQENDLAALSNRFNSTQEQQAKVIGTLQKEIDDLLNKVNKLEEIVAFKDEEIDRLKRNVVALTGDVTGRDAAIEVFRKDLVGLRGELKVLKDRVAELELALAEAKKLSTIEAEKAAAAITVLQSSVDLLKNEQEELEADKERMQGVIKGLNDDLASTCAALETVTCSLAEVTADLLRVEREKDEQKKALDLVIDGKNIEIEELLKQINEARRNFDNLLKNKNALDEELSDLAAANKLLQGVTDQLHGEKKALLKEAGDLKELIEDQKEDIEKLSDLLNAIRSELADKNKLVENLNADVAAGKTSLENSKQYARAVEQKVEELQTAVIDKDKEIVLLLEEIESVKKLLRDEQNEREKQIASKDKEISAVKKTIEDLEAALVNTQRVSEMLNNQLLGLSSDKYNEIEELLSQVDKLKKELEAAKASSKKEIEQLLAASADLSATLAIEKGARTTLSAELELMKKELKDSRDEVAKLKQDVADANATIQKLEADLLSEAKRFDALVKNTDALRSELQHNQEDIAALQKKLVDKEAEIRSLNDLVIKQKEQLVAQEQRVQELNEEKEKLQYDIEALLKKIKDLEALLAESKANEAKLLSALDASQKANVQLEATNRKLNKEIVEAQEELKKLAERMKQQMKVFQDANAELTASLEDRNNSIKKLHADVDDLLRKLADAEQTLSQLRADYEQLKTDFNEANEQKVVLQDELEISNETVADQIKQLEKAYKELGKLKEMVKELNELLDKKNAAIVGHDKEKQDLMDQLVETGRVVDSLRSDERESVHSLEKRLRENEAISSQKDRELQVAQSQVEALKRSLAVKENEKEADLKLIAALKLENGQLKVDLESLKKEVKDLQNKLADKSGVDEQVKSLLLELERSKAAHQSDAKGWSVESDDLKKMIADLQKKNLDASLVVVNKDGELMRRDGELKDSQILIEKLKRDSGSLESEVDRLKESLRKAHEDIDRLAALQGKVVELEKTIEVHKVTVEEKTVAYTLVIQTNEDLIGTVKQLQDRVAELEKLLAAVKDTDSKLQAALNDANNTIAQLESKNGMLDKNLAYVQRKLDEATKDFALQLEGMRSLQGHGDRVKELTLDVASLQAKIDSLLKEIAALKKSNEEYRAQYIAANERASVLQDELEISNETVAEQVEELAKAYREVGKVRQTVLGLEEKLTDKQKKLILAEENIVQLHKSLEEANKLFGLVN